MEVTPGSMKEALVQEVENDTIYLFMRKIACLIRYLRNKESVRESLNLTYHQELL
jgi:hypothetical protein